MNVLGAALLTAAGLLAGLLAADSLRARVRRREELCRMLAMTAFELGRFKTPLPALFGELSGRLSGAGGEVCRRAAEGLAEAGRPFSEIWAEAVAGLPAPERELLEPLGQVLGRYGTEEQLAAVEGCRKEMERALERARLDAGEKSRVYVGLCTVGALMLAVLLM